MYMELLDFYVCWYWYVLAFFSHYYISSDILHIVHVPLLFPLFSSLHFSLLLFKVLVQHTGPLGTCMDYVQEDLSLMTSEQHRWVEECRRYEVEMEVEKKKSSDALRPFQIELAELEEQLHEQKAKISSTKASIARNDERIQQILKLVATS